MQTKDACLVGKDKRPAFLIENMQGTKGFREEEVSRRSNKDACPFFGKGNLWS